MIVNIAKKDHIEIHPGIKDPGSIDYEFVTSDAYSVTTNDPNGKITKWENRYYNFTYVGGAINGNPGDDFSQGPVPGRAIVTTSGEIPAGAISATIRNIGNSTGLLLGEDFTAGSFSTFSAGDNSRFSTPISYDPSGSTYEIIDIR